MSIELPGDYVSQRQRVSGSEIRHNRRLSGQFIEFVRDVRELVDFEVGETNSIGLTSETYNRTGANGCTYKIEVITYNDRPEHHRIDVEDANGRKRYVFVDTSSVDYENNRRLHAGGHQGRHAAGIDQEELDIFLKEVREQVVTPNSTSSE